MTLFQALQRQQRGMAGCSPIFDRRTGRTVEDIPGRWWDRFALEGEGRKDLPWNAWHPGDSVERLNANWMTLREFPALGDDDDVDTLGGLVVKHSQRWFLRPGRCSRIAGVRFTVGAADELPGSGELHGSAGRVGGTA